MTNTVDKITLPTVYASAFINGDFSSFTDSDEINHIQKIMDDLAKDGWAIVDVEEEGRFTWSYRLYQGFNADGGDVSEYTILKAD